MWQALARIGVTQRETPAPARTHVIRAGCGTNAPDPRSARMYGAQTPTVRLKKEHTILGRFVVGGLRSRDLDSSRR